MVNEMVELEIANGAPGFYRDLQGRSHFVSRAIGEIKVEEKLWVEISKEEAIANSGNIHRETVGISDTRIKINPIGL